MEMIKLISFFIGPPSIVNVTDRGISSLNISVSELFREEIFQLVRLQIIGAKICGIFHTSVISKFLMNFLTNFLLRDEMNKESKQISISKQNVA